MYEKDHPERLSHYKNLDDKLNWTNVNFPSSNIDIDTLEENNDGKIAVNVYFLNPEDDKQSILLLYRKQRLKEQLIKSAFWNLKTGMTTIMFI